MKLSHAINRARQFSKVTPDELEDFKQSVYLECLTTLGNIPEEHPEAERIANRVAMRMYREKDVRRRRIRVVEQQTDCIPAKWFGMTPEQHELEDSLLTILSPFQRDIIILKLRGYSDEEAGEKLGCKRRTIIRHRMQALDILGDHYGVPLNSVRRTRTAWNSFGRRRKYIKQGESVRD